jgi:hypothetical protein
MNSIKYFLGVILLVLATMSSAGAENFDSRDLLFDTMINGLDEKDITDQEKEEMSAKIEAWVDDLSDEQVLAFNQSLNNALRTPWSVDFTDPENWELLDLALDNNYNEDQIIALTKALESEAKFLSHYERTGKEFFLLKAEQEKNKFLAKVDRFDDSTIESDIKDETRFMMRELARQARQEAKAEAWRTSRSEIRTLSKNSAREARNEAKNSRHGQGRGNQKPNK